MTLPRGVAPHRVDVELRHIAERLHDAGLLVSATKANARVRGVTDDSRMILQGDLFCAWKGNSSDSHEFVPTAERAGAAAAVVERAVSDCALPQLVVRDGRRGAAAAASFVYGEPAQRLVLAGVTGTNGKTTTAWMVRHLLSTERPAALIGTLGLWEGTSGPVEGTESLTTPGPVDLAALFRTLLDRGIGAVAMEVSSHALDQGRVYAARFDVAIFTNLTRDHLDYHGTLENYLEVKRSFVQLLRQNGAAIVNLDDPAWLGLAELAPRSFTFSVDPSSGADVRAARIQLHDRGCDFDLLIGKQCAEVQLPILGDFNVQNALGAATAAHALGQNIDDIAAALSTVPQVPGRLERIAETPVPVLRDYAHTPDALERVLITLRPLVRGRLITVFGAGGDRDKGKRALMGEIAQRLSDLAIVTSDNPRTEDPDSIIDQIATGMRGGAFVRETDRRAAIATALDRARPGDLVLLAGKGHENYQIVGTTKHVFDERVIVHELAASKTLGVRA